MPPPQIQCRHSMLHLKSVLNKSELRSMLHQPHSHLACSHRFAMASVPRLILYHPRVDAASSPCLMPYCPHCIVPTSSSSLWCPHCTVPTRDSHASRSKEILSSILPSILVSNHLASSHLLATSVRCPPLLNISRSSFQSLRTPLQRWSKGGLMTEERTGNDGRKTEERPKKGGRVCACPVHRGRPRREEQWR